MQNRRQAGRRRHARLQGKVRDAGERWFSPAVQPTPHRTRFCCWDVIYPRTAQGKHGGSALPLSPGLSQPGDARGRFWYLTGSYGRAAEMKERNGGAWGPDATVPFHGKRIKIRHPFERPRSVIHQKASLKFKVLTAPARLTDTKESFSPQVLVSVTVSKIESVRIFFLFLFNWLVFLFFGKPQLILTVSLLKMEKPLCSNIA